MIGIVEWLPGVRTDNTCVLVGGAVFVGFVNAAMPFVMRVASWPIAPLAVAVVALTVNGLTLAAAQPITMAWQFTAVWQGAAAVVMLTALSTAIVLCGEGPFPSSLEAGP